MKPNLLAALTLATALMLCIGCEQSGVTSAISTSCSQIGTQCQLPGGPLGVCQQLDCPAGTAGLCFKCVSQH
jgi:hypothetical protein